MYHDTVVLVGSTLVVTPRIHWARSHMSHGVWFFFRVCPAVVIEGKSRTGSDVKVRDEGPEGGGEQGTVSQAR